MPKKNCYILPYICSIYDRMLEYLDKEYELTVILYRLSDKYKQWGNYIWNKGFTFDELSLKKKTQLIKI